MVVERLLISEILVKVNNAKDKPKEDSSIENNMIHQLRMVLKSSFDLKIQWNYQPGDIPFKK